MRIRERCLSGWGLLAPESAMAWLAVWLLAATGCAGESDKVAVGDEGGACFSDGTCDGALVCAEERCADSSSESDSPRDGVADSNGDEGPDSSIPSCLESAPVNVMMLVDGSEAMAEYWLEIRSAIEEMVNTTGDSSVRFGLHVFHADRNIAVSLNYSPELCGGARHDLLDVARDSGQSISDALGSEPPGGRGPLINALQYYLDNDTMLRDPDATNYLVVLSDANDECFEELFPDDSGAAAAMTWLAAELQRENIRVLPIGFNTEGATTTSADGSEQSLAGVNASVLNALTDSGGSGMTAPAYASTASDLTRVLNEIAPTLRSCRFELPEIEGARSPDLTFELDETSIRRDRTHQQGWDFRPGNTAQIEFFGQACAHIRRGHPVLGCESGACAAVLNRVVSRPQALHLLLDASGSMSGSIGLPEPGIRDSEGNFLNPQLGSPRFNTPWDKVRFALADLMLSPIHDDVQFGLQLFPSADGSGCDVLSGPEVDVGHGRHMAIFSRLAASHPMVTNATPLVESYEALAAQVSTDGPEGLQGLADPDTRGAV